MLVPSPQAARLTLNSAATLEKSYIKLTWELPEACIKAEQALPIKLLLPFVHWHSSQDGKSCACSRLKAQVPPSERKKRKRGR